jgi:uncharacterized membrane protein YhaH (DUF805 family)
MGDSMDWLSVLFGFNGRINRAKFWLGIVMVQLCALVSAFISISIFDYKDLLLLFGIPVWWMILSIYTKRLHDLDASAWWLIVVILVPVLPFLLLGLIKGTDGVNHYGQDPLYRPATSKAL